MRIAAVIPARAGSKGIPNKNIRLLNGKPLICYVLENALRSRYITDVIVSTDSSEISQIAARMGFRIHKRPEELCGDMVTLDSVVYDAVHQDLPDYDYIVTMQPTSPTLTAETLDYAIEFATQGEYDTVISANNRPHLAWTRNDSGALVPAYRERLNRQYLPPYYSETGAFVISSRKVVTPSSRFGGKIAVFEIPDAEAVDIDSYEDLMIADCLLNRKKVAFYVKGDNQHGIGRICQTLELADEFFSPVDIYYDVQSCPREAFGNTTHRLIGVNGFEELFSTIREKYYRIFINDVLTSTADFMRVLRSCLPEDAKIINFEDDGEGAPFADLVFNALFSEGSTGNMRTGGKYFIASKLFLFYHPVPLRKKVEKVFISFGGSDSRDYTDRLLKIISQDKYQKYHFHVVLGRAKANAESLLRYNQFSHITVEHDVRNMPDIMSDCDVAVTSRGRTAYELAMLGVPTIAMAQNLREEKHGFVCEENGFSYLGLDPSDRKIEGMLNVYLDSSEEERLHYRNLLLSHDLRNGRKRVMNLINAI